MVLGGGWVFVGMGITESTIDKQSTFLLIFDSTSIKIFLQKEIYQKTTEAIQGD